MAWDADVSRRLREFLSAASGGTLAAFDADGTLWDFDVGESFLRWAGDTGRLPAWGRPGAAWAEYDRRLAAGDLRHAFDFCITAFEGLPDAEVAAWADEFARPRCEAAIFPAMRELVRALDEAEAEVWVVSGSPLWCVAPGAALLGIPRERVIAAVPAVDGDGLVTDRLASPLPTQEAKVEALLAAAGRPPHFAAGNTEYDYPMLESARVLSLLIDPPEGDGWHSRKNGPAWLVQRWRKAAERG